MNSEPGAMLILPGGEAGMQASGNLEHLEAETFRLQPFVVQRQD